MAFFCYIERTMKNKKSPRSFLDNVCTYVTIILGSLSGILFAFSIVCAVNHSWTEFGIYLAIAIVLLIITIPLMFRGDIYKCPKCGHEFKINPYKLFFTKGMLCDLEGTPTKYVKLKCPKCHSKDYCKRRWK